MKNVVIVVESDVTRGSLYFGKSGDLAIIDYFLRQDRCVYLVEVSDVVENKKRCFLVKKKHFIDVFMNAMYHECRNISEGMPPSVLDELLVKLDLEEKNLDEVQDFMLFSRAMPQSLSDEFVEGFGKIAIVAKRVVQNVEMIAMYKDKVLPYLLQKNVGNIDVMRGVYSGGVQKLGVKEIDIGVETCIFDVENVGEIVEYVKNLKEPFCVKPFNLFGGVGVKVFESFVEGVLVQHLGKITEEFARYDVNDGRFVLVQKAVKHAKFGDIRVLFAKGKFLGAFKRFEPLNGIHNTMHGGRIVPVCDGDWNFSDLFEEKYRGVFKKAIEQLVKVIGASGFLQNEFVCGYDFLLDEENGLYKFILTEANIACPTGFAFLDQCVICMRNENITKGVVVEYFKKNKRTVDIILDEIQG